MTRCREVTSAPLSAGNGRRRGQPALSLATSSDAAYAVGQRREPVHCEDCYQELPTVGRHPVVL